MTYETITTLSGDQVVLNMVVGNFVQALKSVHGLDDFVLDLVVRAARHTTQHPDVIAQGVVGHLERSRDKKDATKLLEALVITLRNQEN